MQINKRRFYRLLSITLSVLMLLEIACAPVPDAKTKAPKKTKASIQKEAKVSSKLLFPVVSKRPSIYISRLRKEPLPILVEKEWKEIGRANNALSIATTGGKLFAVTKDNKLLMRPIEPATQKWRIIGNSENAISIAGTRGQIFAVTRNNILIVTSASGWKKIGSAANTISIAIARGKLFGITKDNKLLVRGATPSTEKWKEIGDSANALNITNIGGKLVVTTESSKLLVREAMPSSASWKTVAARSDMISMSTSGKKIFGLTKDGKVHIQPLPGAQKPTDRDLPGIRIKDLPTWLENRFRSPNTNRRAKESKVIPASSKKQFDKIISKFERVEKSAAEQKAAEYKIKKAKKASHAFEKKKPAIETGWLMMTDPGQDETLRVLIFDSPLELTQTLTHEGLTYPLDNPSIRVSPPSPYVGYVIVADRIVFKEEILTKGHDLVLVAKEILMAPNTNQVSLNTQPDEMNQAAEEQEGWDANNGGDIIFITKDFRDQEKVQVITIGGKGQNGGNGRSTSNPQIVDITREEKEIINASLWGKFNVGGTLKGTVVNSQPNDSFYDNPPSCWFDKLDPSDSQYYAILPCPERGQYGLANTARDSAHLTTIWVKIESQYYPTHGKSGGYGGLPGKISLIMPEPPIETDIAFSAETGSEGTPGEGGNGGEFTPARAYNFVTGDPYPEDTLAYINRNSRDNVKITSRIDPEGTTTYSKDRFHSIVTMPSSRLNEALIRTEVTGAIKVYYYASIDSKNSGDPSRLSEKWPIQPYLKRSAFLYRCSLTSLQYMLLPNIVSYRPEEPGYWPSTLGLTIHAGRDGDPLPSAPRTTETINLIEDNWYNAVYELVPEYPERLAGRADKMYRAGDFSSALPFYQDVIEFSNNSEFESIELMSDALYRIDLGNSGLDYFGLQPDTIIPISPSRDIDLITHYSSAVKFFNESIRDAISSGMQLSQFIGVLEEFARQHSNMMDQIQNSITDTEFEFAALMLEMDAMRHEIDATHRANIRMGGLLETWLNFVNDRVERLKAERPDPKPDWQVGLEAAWNFVKFAAAVVAVVFGFVAALTKATDAWDEMSNMNNNYIEFQDSLGNAVDNLESLSDIDNALESLESPWEDLTDSAKNFADLIKAAAEAIDKPLKEAKKLYDELTKLMTTSDAWTQDEAIDFRNNVLLAEQIDVSGGMTYLQIQEQMKLNDDLLIAKYLALEAANVGGMRLAERILSLTRELLRHEVNRRYLLEIIDALDVQNATIESVQEQLNDIGQGVLDAMMRRLQEHKFQLKFLELTFSPTPGRYDRFIESPVDVAAVLDSELQLRENINQWTSVNANIGRLKIFVSRTSSSQLGKLILVSTFGLDNFSSGEYARPLEIYAVEPLRETQLIRDFAAAIGARLNDIPQLVTFLKNQYPTEVGAVIKGIVDRERQYHSILNDPTFSLEDSEIVIAYSLAAGGVTPSILGQMLSQTTLTDPLKSTLQKIQAIWPALSIEITTEDVKSLRQVSQAVEVERQNPSNAYAILNDAFIVSNSPASLSRFHLNPIDVQDDISVSYDPDFPTYQVLGNIHNSDDLNVIIAITLLYAGLNKAEVQAVANQYSAGHLIGDRLVYLLPEWDNLRRSVLERKHTFLINIERDDFMALPNISGTFEHRFLAGRAQMTSQTGPATLGVILKKLPEDGYVKQANDTLTITFPIEEQLAFPEPIATPPSFVLSDYHYNSLFGRSVLGEWELSLNMKGNSPTLPNIQNIELEMIYSHKK